MEEVEINYSTPFGDAMAEQRHDDIMRTFRSLFYQWFAPQVDKSEFISQFNQIDESVIQEMMDPVLMEAIQHVQVNEQPAFALTYFAILEFINKLTNLPNGVRPNATVFDIEFWFNYRKHDENELLHTLPMLKDIRTISTMLFKFLSCYQDLSQHPAWRMLYTFFMINMLGVYERISFKPNVKSIGGFVNITGMVEML